MCGIVGFSGPIGQAAQAILLGMLSPIRHRGPDAEGVHVCQDVALGHVRLAVIDLRGGAQPRVENDAALVFNGEIYGYRELAGQLRQQGVPLQDSSDTEVLFRLLQRHPVEKVVGMLDGMFAFAFCRNGAITLARDRFGEKPLFYGIRSGVLVFASELGALKRHPLFAQSPLDRAAAARYLTLQYLPGEDTGWMGIRKLPPGHLLKFENGLHTLVRYWHPVIGKEPQCGEEDREARIDRLEHLLFESVRKRLVADVPVGVFLSGGLDSSLVTACASRHTRDLTAFSVRMQEDSFDESHYATMVSRHLGVRHEIIELGSNALIDAFDVICEKLDEPFADASLLPTYLVCRSAKRHATVVLGGDGADELFAGYPNFWVRPYADMMALFPGAVGALLRKLLDCLPHRQGYMNYSFLLRQLSYGFGMHPDHQSHQWMAAFTAEDQDDLWRAGLQPSPGDGGLALLVDETLDQSGCVDAFSRLTYLFLTGYLAEDILVKVDRASMYNSLEVRAPFLAHELAAYALSLPRRDKLKGRDGKRLLKDMALRHLPAEVVQRKKHGFSPPLGAMLRGSIKDRVRHLLLESKAEPAGWFRQDVIKRYWDEHQSGRRDHHRKLWTLAMLFLVAGRAS